jgi:sugar lactone lactonase YvrE
MLDYSSSSIHQVWRNSNAVVLAGSGVSQGHGYADGIGNQARFNLPVGIAVDGDENLYVADTGNDMIRKITPAGLVSTIGANPTRAGLAAGIGRFSDFADPTSIAIGPDGSIYVANKLNHNIVKGVWIGPEIKISQWNPETQQYGSVDTPATISLHPTMPGFQSSVSLRIENIGASTLTNLSLSLTGTHASEYSITNAPVELATGAQATVVIQCTGSISGTRSATLTIHSSDVDEPTSTIQLSKLVLPNAPTGQYSWERFAGSFTEQGFADGPRLKALFQANGNIAFAATGEMLVALSGQSSVRKIDKNGVVEHVAGVPEFSGLINGDAMRARFRSIKDVTVARSGDVYVSEGNTNGIIRKITPAGVVSTVATITGSSAQNVSLFYDESQQRLLMADDLADVIHSFSTNGTLSVFAGISGTVGATNGSLTTSTFSNPRGMCMDLAGNLYVCDSANHLIRKISPQGAVTTYAGIAGQVGNIDGDRSVATFSSPRDIALASDESLIITCPGSHTVRKISKTGAVTTIGGVAGSSGKVAGVGSDARFMSPHSVAVAPDGRIYVATSNHIMQSTLLGADLAVVAADGDTLASFDNGIVLYSSFPGSMTRTLVCRNVGSAPIPSLVAYTSGLFANRFSIPSPLAGTGLQPGASDVMSLRFQPLSATSTDATLRFGQSTLSPMIRQYKITGSVIATMSFWNWENFGTLEQTGSNAPTADPDGDGLINLLEYAFNLEPQMADFSYVNPLGGSGLPVVRLVESLGTRELRMEYIRRRATSNPGISYVAEFSSNLSNDATLGWKAATGTPTVTPIDDTWERVVVRDVTGGANRFGRVRVVLSP